MPKSKETISDSESGSGSEKSEEEVKSKSKPKKQPKKKASSESEDSGSESDSKSKKRTKNSKDDKGSNKKVKKDSSKDSSKSKNANGEEIWDIGGRKQVTVRQFKGKWFVDIREMYEKDGELCPGKKGVCLNLENWRELYKVVDEVNETVKSKC